MGNTKNRIKNHMTYLYRSFQPISIRNYHNNGNFDLVLFPNIIKKIMNSYYKAGYDNLLITIKYNADNKKLPHKITHNGAPISISEIKNIMKSIVVLNATETLVAKTAHVTHSGGFIFFYIIIRAINDDGIDNRLIELTHNI